MAEPILLYAYRSAQFHDIPAPPAPSWMGQEISVFLATRDLHSDPYGPGLADYLLTFNYEIALGPWFGGALFWEECNFMV